MFFLTPTLLLNKNLNENIIEGIYTPGWKAITPSGIDDLISTIDRNQLNTLMVNVKNARGELFYNPETDLAKKIGSQAKTKEGLPRTLNFDYLFEQASKHNLRLIARHVMFWDNNLYDKQENFRLYQNGSQRWVDMTNDDVINYNLSLLEEESKLGFDEIVLDYIRFPTTNKFGSERKKCKVIDEIVEKAREKVNIDLGVQVFGYTAWHHSKAGVGQRIETLQDNVDVIYPMLYPSHFHPKSFGFENPSDYPYEFISMGFENAVKKVKNTKIIPMIQAFWYNPEKIKLQIDAVHDFNMPGYICWNSSGNYEILKK